MTIDPALESTTLGTTGLPLAAGTWVLDPAHSSIEFRIRHLGLSRVRGRFREFGATLVVGETLDTSSVAAEIAMSSVDTNNADRDAHLRSTDFFGADDNPTMSFRSTSISGEGDQWTMGGDLTLNGRTKLVTLDVEFPGMATDPYGNEKAGFSATTKINRKDYGIEFNAPLETGGMLLADSVDIELELQFVVAG